MKATGIVRRIDPCVIIGQNLKDRRNTGFSLILSKASDQKIRWYFDRDGMKAG